MKDEEIEHYEVTGLLYNTNRKRFCITTKDFRHAMSINLWRGSVWARLKKGKRKLIKRVWN